VLLSKLQNTTSQLPLCEIILQILWILVLVQECKTIISQKEGIKCITTAMNTYKMSPTIQTNGCIVLVELALHDHTGKIQESIYAIIKGMKFHRKHSGVQEHGCAALAILTMLNDDKKKEETEKKAIAAVIDTMNAHISSEEIQEWGCAALASLVHANEQNTEVIAQQGGIKTIVNSIIHYGSCPDIQESAYVLLEELALTNQSEMPETLQNQMGQLKEFSTFIMANPTLKDAQEETLELAKQIEVEIVKYITANKIIKKMEATPNINSVDPIILIIDKYKKHNNNKVLAALLLNMQNLASEKAKLITAKQKQWTVFMNSINQIGNLCTSLASTCKDTKISKNLLSCSSVLKNLSVQFKILLAVNSSETEHIQICEKRLVDSFVLILDAVQSATLCNSYQISV